MVVVVLCEGVCVIIIRGWRLAGEVFQQLRQEAANHKTTKTAVWIPIPLGSLFSIT